MKVTLMCPRCGFTRTPQETNRSYDICEYCKARTIQIDFPPDDFCKTQGESRVAIENKIYRKFLYNNPQFDEKVFEQRLEDDKKEEEELERKFAESDRRTGGATLPRCPTCNSTNIKPIGGLERGVSVLTLGLFSKKINKTFKCNNCGHTW